MGYADTGMPERESFLTHLYNEKNEQKIILHLVHEKRTG